VNSENPTEETISLLSDKSDKTAHLATSGASYSGAITNPPIAPNPTHSLDGSKSGIHIEIGTKNSKNISKMPRMASTMKIHPGRFIYLFFAQKVENCRLVLVDIFTYILNKFYAVFITYLWPTSCGYIFLFF